MAESFAVEGGTRCASDESVPIGGDGVVGFKEPRVDFAGEFPGAGESDTDDDGSMMTELYEFVRRFADRWEFALPESIAEDEAGLSSMDALMF